MLAGLDTSRPHRLGRGNPCFSCARRGGGTSRPFRVTSSDRRQVDAGVVQGRLAACDPVLADGQLVVDGLLAPHVEDVGSDQSHHDGDRRGQAQQEHLDLQIVEDAVGDPDAQADADAEDGETHQHLDNVALDPPHREEEADDGEHAERGKEAEEGIPTPSVVVGRRLNDRAVGVGGLGGDGFDFHAEHAVHEDEHRDESQQGPDDGPSRDLTALEVVGPNGSDTGGDGDGRGHRDPFNWCACLLHSEGCLAD